MNTDCITLEVSPRNGKPTRLVIARFGEDGEHRATFNTDSDTSRERFIKKLAVKAKIDDEQIDKLDRRITQAADEADAEAVLVAANDDAPGSEGVEDGERKSQATQLVDLAIAEEVTLFHDPDGMAYARYRVEDHHEVARVASGQFKRWLARLYFDRTGKAPNSQAKADAAGVLEGMALYDGEKRSVYVRVAEFDGRIYLDLCNEAWQAVEIDASGWRVVEPPVMFRRAKAMLPLPSPQAGGSIDELREFIDTDEKSFVLIVAWLLAAVRPRGPYPVLQLDGEQGSGKSTRAKMLRMLVDPNTADLRSEPKEPRDLMIAANNGHVIALDNLSHLPDWLSDCLCRLATGGGFSTRTLYENDEETIFNAQRPVMLTGIEQVASRGDLIDRGELVSLLAIPENKRRPEAELWAAFDVARPRMLGAVLTAVSGAIKNLPTTRPASLPRMADFALWITAAESALGWRPGTFMAAYTGNRAEADLLAIESSVIGKTLIEFLDVFDDWDGTATDLLENLEKQAGLSDANRKPKGWPGNAKSLSGQIKRIAPHLRKVGFEVEWLRDETAKRKRCIAIRRTGHSYVQSVQTVQDPGKLADSSDAIGSPWTHAEANWTQVTPSFHSDRTQADALDAKSHPEVEEEMVEWS